MAHRRPSNAGERRYLVSREFDTAYRKGGFDLDRLPELADELARLIKAAWTSPAQRAGWDRVRMEAVTAFRRYCRERLIAIPAKVHLSQRRVVEVQHCRIVDIHDNDRKRFDDMKPRIRRDNSAFLPMEQVVADVKPLDNIVLRADGTKAWPKMIAFQDAGTHRVFARIVLLDRGEGVRQQHIVETFLEMVADPEWGFPQQLYLDNGSEFAVFDMIRDALAIINDPGARTIVHAKAYSGASKPIESKFATLDRAIFSQMGGWAGGNRLNKKTQTVGKPPAPYAGSFEAFTVEALERIAVFEHELIKSGPFKGRSPASTFADRVADGWRPVRVDPTALDAAFCKRDTRRSDRGALSIAGTRYRHPELPNGRTVNIALPFRRGAWPLVELPDLGWAYLEPDMLHLPGEVAGAIESGRMQRANVRAVRSVRRGAGTIDLAANHGERVAQLPTRAVPAPLIDVMLSSQAEEFAAARAEADQRLAAVPDQAERRRQRLMEETEELERHYGRNRA